MAGPSSVAGTAAAAAAADTGAPGQGPVDTRPFGGGVGFHPPFAPWTLWPPPYVVPLHMADVRRPPPPLWLGCSGVPAPKIYSGVFSNCTFN